MKDFTIKLDEIYNNWKWEAETFFVTKFIDTDTIKNTFSNCLDVVFNITKTVEYNRGIVAYNPAYGQGKTFFFDVTNHRYRRKTGRNLFVKTTSKDLVNLFVQEGEQALLKFITCKNLFIDDIGDEGKVKIFKHFGHEMNVLRYVILKRYEFWTDDEKEWKTFATTNLTKEQMAKEYGGRVADRLAQMCHWIDFKFLGGGKSFRQYDGTRKLTKEEVSRKWKQAEEALKRAPKQEFNMLNYLNELLQEDDEYLDLNDFTRWNLIKPYLVERKLVNLDQVDDKLLEGAEAIARLQVKRHTRGTLKHAKESMMLVKAKQASDKVTSEQVYHIAELLLVKKAFKALKEKEYVFK